MHLCQREAPLWNQTRHGSEANHTQSATLNCCPSAQGHSKFNLRARGCPLASAPSRLTEITFLADAAESLGGVSAHHRCHYSCSRFRGFGWLLPFANIFYETPVGITLGPAIQSKPIALWRLPCQKAALGVKTEAN